MAGAHRRVVGDREVVQRRVLDGEVALFVVVAVVHGNGLLDALLPIIDNKPEYIEIDAITAAQFEDVPTLETPGIITRYEEDRIQAYFGGGYMYATPERSEAWI